ncbi:MAG: hypothetical protein PHP30_09375 [Bacteroidales bacterium]|nr:hypothetical protein [Bacteroidales bacterium]MDD2424790.1 hypothetical protein [Bacteroidales bacterium]MDD3990287.1 hypothetical protein [Bacteroidales bacterium]MDD4638191.1 hypothetical protein [Bacteroidales bacterium]
MKKSLLLIIILFSHLLCLAQGDFSRGEGSVTFTKYEPLSSKPVTLHYYIPTRGNVESMYVLFVMHDSKRDGKYELETWKDFAERDGFVVLAPEFKKEYYNQTEYQRGGITYSESNLKIRSKEKWTTQIIEAIFTYYKEETGSRASKYDIWGSAWGAQFIQAFLISIPDARIRTAVMSKAANYIMPFPEGLTVDKDVFSWPFSLLDSPFGTNEYLKPLFDKHIIVHVGEEDTRNGEGYPQDPASYAQGQNCNERARYFYNESKNYAKENKMKFKWEFVEVPGVGSLSRSLVYGLSSRDRNNNRVYDINRVKKTAAYYLLFGY